MATPPAASAALHSSDWAWLRRPYGLLLVMAVLALAFAGRLSANPVQVGSGGALGGSLTINKIVTSGGAIPAGGWTFHLVGNGATCQGDAMPTPTLDLLITVPATGGTVSTDPFPVTNDLGQFCTYTLTEVPVAGWQSSLPAAGVTFTFTTGATLPAPLSWDGTNILAQVTNTPVDDGGEVGSSTTTTTPPPDDTTPPITGTGSAGHHLRTANDDDHDHTYDVACHDKRLHNVLDASAQHHNALARPRRDRDKFPRPCAARPGAHGHGIARAPRLPATRSQSRLDAAPSASGAVSSRPLRWPGPRGSSMRDRDALSVSCLGVAAARSGGAFAALGKGSAPLVLRARAEAETHIPMARVGDKIPPRDNLSAADRHAPQP